MKVVYVQPRTHAGKNYRSGDGTEQTWTPWWALLLQGKVMVEAELIDARVDEDWTASLTQALSASERTLVAVTSMTGAALRDAIQASQIAREAGAEIIWGGPHATLFPDEVSNLPYVDHVIQGFGASAFGALVRETEAGHRSDAILDARGESSGVPVTISRGPVAQNRFGPDLTLVPAWEPYINSDHALGDRVVNLVTSEGCLRRCTYCSEPTTSQNSWLTYDVVDCVSVARSLVDAASATAVKLHDPNFLQDVPRGLRFANLFAASVGTPWAATIHPADVLELEYDDLRLLAGSGLRRVLVGLESSDQDLVNQAGKRFDVRRIPEIATKLSTFGIAGMFTFICGWPGAHPDHYQRTIDCAFSIREIDERHQAKIHFLEPWPGTPIHRVMERTLSLPKLSIEQWADVDYYFAHHQGLHDSKWEERIRIANQELSPYVEA